MRGSQTRTVCWEIRLRHPWKCNSVILISGFVFTSCGFSPFDLAVLGGLKKSSVLHKHRLCLEAPFSSIL